MTLTLTISVSKAEKSTNQIGYGSHSLVYPLANIYWASAIYKVLFQVLVTLQ